jgi:hypothetical protein
VVALGAGGGTAPRLVRAGYFDNEWASLALDVKVILTPPVYLISDSLYKIYRAVMQ